MSNNRILNSTTGIVLLGLTVAAISIISNFAYFRLDVTEDKVYSLSQGSLNIAKTFDDEVNIKFYFSRSLKGLPVAFKTYATRVEEVLKEFQAQSDDNIQLDIIDPKPDTDEEVWARKYGISSVSLQNEELYLGAVFLSGEKEIAIPYLDPRKEEFLEYDIAEALVKLKNNIKPKLGIMSSLQVSGSGAPPNPMMGQQGPEDWAFVSGLKNFFDVTNVELTTEKIDPSVSILVVIHPKKIEDKTAYAIDQFLMRGGKLIVAVDPFSRVDLASNAQNRFQGGRMPEASSDFTRFFSHWGIEYSKGDMIGDPYRATRINTGGQAVNYPFFMSLTKEDFSSANKVTAHLKQMLIAEGGALSLKEGSQLKFEPLIQTSQKSGKQSASMANFMRPSDLAAQLKTEDKKRTLAGFLTGKLTSAFPTPPQGAENHLNESANESTVLIIADADFLHDSNSVDKIRFGPQVIVRPRNDNLNFLINAAEFLGGNPDLISIRSSGKVNRPFTTVMEIQQEAQKKWKKVEENLSKQLSDLQQKLNQLQQQRTDGNMASLSSQQQQEIERFREEEVKIRNKRREVRKNLREDIENLGHKIVAANLIVVPLMVSIFGIMVFFKREKRARGN